MNKIELLSKKIIRPCDCWTCSTQISRDQDPLVYKILNTVFTIRRLVGINTYWKGCPRNIDAIPFLFEEIFDSVSDNDKLVLIFNLNNFKDMEGVK